MSVLRSIYMTIRFAVALALSAAVVLFVGPTFAAEGPKLPPAENSQLDIFFNASNKYSEWFQETRLQNTQRGIRFVSSASSTAVTYPYPDKAFVMTEKRWLKSANEAINGKPDWFDVEVVRQRAEVEEYAPAMDLLGWMYQEGRGLNKDLRKAYNMYERAKLAGKPKIRGNTAKIFDRLNPPEQLFAKIQLLDDIRRIKPDAATAKKSLDQVRVYVLKQQRKLNTLRRKHKRAK